MFFTDAFMNTFVYFNFSMHTLTDLKFATDLVTVAGLGKLSAVPNCPVTYNTLPDQCMLGFAISENQGYTGRLSHGNNGGSPA